MHSVDTGVREGARQKHPATTEIVSFARVRGLGPFNRCGKTRMESISATRGRILGSMSHRTTPERLMSSTHEAGCHAATVLTR